MASVLIADSSEIMRTRYATMLQELGYEAIEATDGESAVDLYRQTMPAAALLEVVLPGIDGIAALGEIMEQDPHARVAMVSIMSSREIVEEALAAGAEDFVAKPFDSRTLREMLERLVA